MFCKNCGAELPEGAKFCGSCGASQDAQAEQVVVTAEPEIVAEVPAEAPVQAEAASAAPKPNPLKTLVEKAKPLLARVKPTIEKAKPFVLQHKLPIMGAAGGLLLIIAIAIIIGVCTSGNGFIGIKNAITAGVFEDTVSILWNDKVVDTKIEAGYVTDQRINLDGTVLAFLTDENELYVARNKKAYKVAEGVSSFRLSAEGKGLAYVCQEDDEHVLKLYNVGTKKSKVVMEDCDIWSMTFYGFELAPNGKSMAYYQMNDDYEPILMYFNGSKSVEITDDEVDLLGLNDGGKDIYVIGDDDGDDVIYTYNKRGDRDKIGTCNSTSVYFNNDHTQLMYFNDGKTYLSVNGKSGSRFSSGKASLILSNDSMSMESGESVTCPVKDLYNHVYAVYHDGQYNLWTLKKNSDRSEKLVSDVTGWQLDADCEYVYYFDEDDSLCCIKIAHGDNASERAVTLADDVDKFVVTSDRKTLYYISGGDLYSCNAKNGRGERTIAEDDVQRYYLVLNAKDVVYYIVDEDCYACSNGRRGTKVLSDAGGLTGFGNGVVYVATEDALYATDGAKRLSKIYEMD